MDWFLYHNDLCHERVKHSEIWNKVIDFQRKYFVEQPSTNKVKKCKFLQELCFNKLLLKQSENLPSICSACKAKRVLVACNAIFKF